MTFQAYIDNVKKQTGKGPADFAKVVREKGLVKHGDIVRFLKEQYGLGHGHATAVTGVILKARSPPRSKNQKFDDLFSGSKAVWHEPANRLIAKVSKFGSDVHAVANSTYVNLLRGDGKFGILQPASASRLDIGIKLKGEPAADRFELAGTWNAMVSHRVRISEAAEIDSDVIAWLKTAYLAAGK